MRGSSGAQDQRREPRREARPRSPRLDTASAALLTALGALIAAACATTAERPADPPPVITVAPSAPPPAASSAPPITASAVAPPAVSAAAPPSGTDPTTLVCGASRCQVGKETCCSYGPKDELCVPSVDDPIAQERACEAANHGYSINHVARCDESADCGPTNICCRQVLHSGASIMECVPPAKGGATPCDWGEVCEVGSTCRVPGTVCVDGRCTKAPKIACGGTTCGGDKPVCCDGDRCTTAADCPPSHRVTCRSNADCLQGQLCAVNVQATACLGAVVSPEHLGVACKRASDCPKCTTKGAGPQCNPSLIPGINACSCPYGP